MNGSKCPSSQHSTWSKGESIENGFLMRLAFYLIFPGFFIYHFLIAEQYLPPFLGGYSTSISVLLFPFLCLAYAKHALQKIRHFSFIEVGFLVFTVYFGFVVLFHVALGADTAIAGPLLAIIPQFIAIFIVAKLVNPATPEFKRDSIFFFVVLTGIIFLNTSDGVFSVSNLDTQLAADHFADYQGYAFVYIVTALFLLTNLRLKWMRGSVYVTAIPGLLFNGARTEFVGFFAVALFIEFCLTRHKMEIFVAAVALLLGILALHGLIGGILPDNRVLALIANYQMDESVIARMRLLHAAWDTLGNHPFLGSFASYEPGEYVHNVLSAWVDVGLLGFLAYLALMVYPMVDLLSRFSKHSRDPSYILTLSVVILVVIFSIAAKHFTYQMFPIAVGLYARFIMVNRRKRATPIGHEGIPNHSLAKPIRSLSGG